MAEQTFSQLLRDYRQLVDKHIVTNNRNEIDAPIMNDLLKRIGILVGILDNSINREIIYSSTVSGFSDEELNEQYPLLKVGDKVVAFNSMTEYEKISSVLWVRKPIQLHTQQKERKVLSLSLNGKRYYEESLIKKKLSVTINNREYEVVKNPSNLEENVIENGDMIFNVWLDDSTVSTALVFSQQTQELSEIENWIRIGNEFEEL